MTKPKKRRGKYTPYMARKYAAILGDLIETINNTGGIKRTNKGSPVPVTDAEWVDLGIAYVDACAALGEDPMEEKNDGAD